MAVLRNHADTWHLPVATMPWHRLCLVTEATEAAAPQLGGSGRVRPVPSAGSTVELSSLKMV